MNTIIKTFNKLSALSLFCVLIVSKALANDVNLIDESPVTIKVLVHQSQDGALVEVKGGCKVSNPINQATLTSSYSAKRHFLSLASEGIKWGSPFSGIFQMRIAPKDPSTTFLLNGTEYTGALEVYTIDNELYFIVETDIEDYIKSRLTNRLYGESMSDAALESIAIAERTMAYFLARKNQEASWHTTNTFGLFNGTVTKGLSPNIDHCVNMTKKTILTYRGAPFPAEINKHCAGTTSNYKAIFRKNVSCPEGVESPIARKSRHNVQWKFKIHRDDLANLAKVDSISGIDLFMDHQNNRTYAIRIKDQGHIKDMSFFELQSFLGEDKLKSNDFSIQLETNFITFEGYGEGHGTGLCLYSSEQMARRGDSTEQILSDFFPHTSLTMMKSLTELAMTN